MGKKQTAIFYNLDHEMYFKSYSDSSSSGYRKITMKKLFKLAQRSQLPIYIVEGTHHTIHYNTGTRFPKVE